MDILQFYTLIEYCRNKRTFIQTHNIPDPDAIGSAYGLKKLLKHYGLNTTICYDGELDRISAAKMLDMFGIEMYAISEFADTMSDDDCIICIDTQKKAGNVSDLNGNDVAVIDHHPEVDRFSDNELVDMEMVYTFVSNERAEEMCDLFDMANENQEKSERTKFKCRDNTLVITSYKNVLNSLNISENEIITTTSIWNIPIYWSSFKQIRNTSINRNCK